MITEAQKQKLISALRNHTLSSVKNNQKTKLPIVISGEDTFIIYARRDNVLAEYNDISLFDDSEIIITNARRFDINPEDLDEVILLKNSDVEYGIKKCRLVNSPKFHYNDKWYAYKYSIEEPQYTFGIIKADHMPYNSFEGRLNKKSFICTAYSLIRQGYCRPFLLFVNGEFVNLNYVNVIFDCDDTYLILYGEKYNYYNLKDAKINMMVLPFDIDYTGIESETHFDMMLSIVKSYIQENVSINENNEFSNLSVFDVDEIYEYRSMIYNIGGWLYTQLRNYQFGMLSEKRISKLTNIGITKTDGYGNSITNKYNILNESFYNTDTYSKFYCLSQNECEDQSIFRFNNNGKISETGSNIVSIVNPDIIKINSFSSSDSHIVHSEDCNTVLIRENYVVFKDGIFFPDCEIQTSINNVIKIDNEDELLHNVYLFYYETLSSDSLKPITHADHFYQEYITNVASTYMQENANFEYTGIDAHVFDNTNNLEEVLQYIYAIYLDSETTYSPRITDYIAYLNSDDAERKAYIEASMECLDLGDNPMASIIQFDPTLLNELYHTNIESVVISGEEANDALKELSQYDDTIGLKITKSKYSNHESYVLVFEDGELIEEYGNMKSYANFFFIPIERSFNPASQIELLYFNNINNNEISVELEDIITVLSWNIGKYDNTFIGRRINSTDLQVFCDYPEDILEYKSLVQPSEDISFNVSYKDGNKTVIIDDIVDNPSNYSGFTAVSKRRFVYKRLYVDKKSYRIPLNGQFKYCDNQKQYVLFINGRRMNDDAFLITIPKYTRPFWGMYLYTSKYVSPEDRIELFYLPDELINTNSNGEVILNEDGYIVANKTSIEVPYDPRLYLVFINGKKIPSSNLIAIDTHTFRVTKDTLSTNNLVINPVYIDTLSEVTEYLSDSTVWSSYDAIIKNIENSEYLGYSELDLLFNTFVKMSNTELDKSKRNVGHIAIVNEIVRDFWISSGYNYNEVPFVYDFATNEYTTKDDNGNIIIPAMDATQFLNIIKSELQLLYFYTDPSERYYEFGSTLNGIKFFWDYAYNEYATLQVEYQKLSYKYQSDDYVDISLDTDDRTYNYNHTISEPISFIFKSKINDQPINKLINISFVNGIYFGNIDEDQLQHYRKNNTYEWVDNIIGLIPKSGNISSTDDQDSEVIDYTSLTYNDNNIILDDLEFEIIDRSEDPINASNVLSINQYANLEDITILTNCNDSGDILNNISLRLYNEDTGLEEYIVSQDLQRALGNLKHNVQLSPEIKLTNYIIGNNKYFVYACPERLALDESNNIVLEFVLPNLNSDSIKAQCSDNKSTPIYTDGEYDSINKYKLNSLDKMEMIYLGSFIYTNEYGYSERYCAWRSNGFFTRAFDDYKFSIEVRYKNRNKSYDDGFGNTIIPGTSSTIDNAISSTAYINLKDINSLEYNSNIINNISLTAEPEEI